MPPPSASLAEDASPHASRYPSLEESHRTIPVPKGGSLWRRLFAFAGPGYLVAVGYMDPGNWATDIAGGSAFGYTLLSVLLMSRLMDTVLQALSAQRSEEPRVGKGCTRTCSSRGSRYHYTEKSKRKE